MPPAVTGAVTWPPVMAPFLSTVAQWRPVCSSDMEARWEEEASAILTQHPSLLRHLADVDRDCTVPRTRRELELALTTQRDEIATLETTGIPGVQVGLGVAYASVRKSAVRGTLNLKYAIPVKVTVSSHEASTRPPRPSA